MELNQLAVPLERLMSQELITTADLQRAIKNALQYTVLDKDETLTDLFDSNNEPFAKKLKECLLGVDADTNRLRLQDTHARNLALLLLSEALPEDILPQVSFISQRVIKKSTENNKGKPAMGRVQANIRITYGDVDTIFDAAPDLNDYILQQEVCSQIPRLQEGYTLESFWRGRGKKNEYLGYFSEMYEEILKNPPDTASLPLNPPVSEEDLMHAPKNSILAALAITLTYLATNETITPEIKQLCLTNLEELVATADELQKLPPQERTEQIKLLDLHERTMNHLSHNETRKTFLRRVLEIARKTRDMLVKY